MDISKAKIKLYSSLAQRKHRLCEGLFVAEGAKCVGETLPFFELETLIVTPDEAESGEAAQRLLTNAESRKRIFTATPAQMRQISSLVTAPSVIAVYKIPQRSVPEPTELTDKLVLALDGIQDPGNLGTIMRTADWFGVRHIIASKGTADIFNPKAVQATMGSIGRVHISYTDLPDYMRKYKAETGMPIYGTLLNGKNIYKATLSGTGMIVMGNEGKGISSEVQGLIDSPLLIPSWPEAAPTVESLNVAMATAITLSQFRSRT